MDQDKICQDIIDSLCSPNRKLRGLVDAVGREAAGCSSSHSMDSSLQGLGHPMGNNWRAIHNVTERALSEEFGAARSNWRIFRWDNAIILSRQEDTP
jgi:hypothetical protein